MRPTWPTLDSLEVSDLEDELAMWMEDRGVEEGGDLPTLAGAGLDTAWLEGSQKGCRKKRSAAFSAG